MCTVAPDIMAKLEVTVQQFLEEGRMFTAYDVTIETRTRDGIMLRHSDVSGACHEIEALVDALDFGFQNSKNQQSKWLRTRRDVPGGKGAWAWIYHPDNLDPNSYQFRSPSGPHTSKPTHPLSTGHTGTPGTTTPTKAAICAQPPGLSISQDGDGSDSGGEQDDGAFAVDFRNRLMIPTRFMRDAGINAGNECYVIPDSTTNTVMICKSTPSLLSGGLKITMQKVEKDGELRLSSKTLKSADLNDNKFVIETTDKDFSGMTTKVVAVSKTN